MPEAGDIKMYLPECAICADELSDPRALPCGHCFCGPPKSCLKLLNQTKTNIKCALCSQVHVLNVESLKPLFGIRDFLQQSSNSKPSFPKCQKHKSKPVSYWCIQCKEKICQECFETDHDEHPMKSYQKFLQKAVSDQLVTLGSDGFKENMLKRIKLCDEQILIVNSQKEKLIERQKVIENEKDTFRMYISNEAKIREFATSKTLTAVDVDMSLIDGFLALPKEPVKKEADIEKMPQLRKVIICAEFSDMRTWNVGANHDSSCIILNNYKWWVRAKKHKNAQEKQFIGLFLGCYPVKPETDWKSSVEFELTLKNVYSSSTNGTPDKTLSTAHTFREKEDDWGWNSFIDFSQVLNSNQGWITESKPSITVHCTISTAE